MDKFWVVTLFHLQPTIELKENLDSEAVNSFNALGIEEFSLNEPEVDELLGERSYSGGDLPQSVLDEVEEKVLSKPTSYRYFFSTNQDAFDFQAHCQKLILAEVQVEEHNEEDWNTEWRKHYSPILVNHKLEIIPSWMKSYSSKASNQLYIYPGMGFGTGSHETTFLCLKLLTEEVKDPIYTALDFGSGSGILGLATLKLYPYSKVDFYDIDLEANKNCYQNAELNNLENLAFRLLLPEVREKLNISYDLVFANILESILKEERDFLIGATRAGGSLILSGLLKHQVDGIIDSYSAGGMVLSKRIEKGDWAALYFIKGKA